ncbi:MAG: response regulator transcription factor [Chitinophagaceae bacterium]|nr:MAG: response regulator transcription factor [Chitinophagaceae bacterium]
MHILLVEDEPGVAAMITKGLTEEGHEVVVAPDGKIGLDMASGNKFDIMILDVMLPGMNGIELCKQLRRQKDHTPVLMLTALASTENIVTGLDAGADDYISKPFKFRELTARIRSLSRRGSVAEVPEILKLADLEMNLLARTVQRNGVDITLTSTEYRLLEYLLKNKGRVVSRLDMLENVWGIDFNMGTNVVDVYVNYLRKKIDRQGPVKLIQTVIGMGYILKEPS